MFCTFQEFLLKLLVKTETRVVTDNKRDHSFRYLAAYWEMSKVAIYKQSHLRHVNAWYKQGKRHLASL